MALWGKPIHYKAIFITWHQQLTYTWINSLPIMVTIGYILFFQFWIYWELKEFFSPKVLLLFRDPYICKIATHGGDEADSLSVVLWRSMVNQVCHQTFLKSSINNRQSQIPTCRAPLPTSFLHHMLSFLCLDFCFVVLIKSLSIFLFHYISKFHPSNSGSIPINTNHCRATIMDTSIHGVMENV